MQCVPKYAVIRQLGHNCVQKGTLTCGKPREERHTRSHLQLLLSGEKRAGVKSKSMRLVVGKDKGEAYSVYCPHH